MTPFALKAFGMALLIAILAELTQASSCSAYSDGIELSGTTSASGSLNTNVRRIVYFYNAAANSGVKITLGEVNSTICVTKAEISIDPKEDTAVCTERGFMYLQTDKAGCYSIGLLPLNSAFTLNITSDVPEELPAGAVVVSDHPDGSCQSLGVSPIVQFGAAYSETALQSDRKVVYFQKKANEAVRLNVVASEQSYYYVSTANAAFVRKPAAVNRYDNVNKFSDELSFTEYSTPACIAVSFSSFYSWDEVLTFSLSEKVTVAAPAPTTAPTTTSVPVPAPTTAEAPSTSDASAEEETSSPSGFNRGLGIGLSVAAVIAVVAVVVVIIVQRRSLSRNQPSAAVPLKASAVEFAGERETGDAITGGRSIPSAAAP